MNYFKSLLAKSMRQRNFWFTLTAAFFIGVGVATYLKVMEPINLQDEVASQKAQAARLVDNYQNYPNESENNQAIYQLLLTNNTLASRQASNLIMEEYSRYNRTNEESAKVQLELWATSFPEKNVLLPVWQLQQNIAVSKQLEKQEKTPVLIADNTQTAVALTLQVLLGFGFFYFAFFASDNLLEERRHFSLIRSYPQVFPVRMISKVFVKMIVHLATIVMLLVGVILTMAIIGQLGDWTYPMPVYFQQAWHTLPFWQYLFLALLLLLGLIFVTELLGFAVNALFPNRYVTFFVLGLCYGLGALTNRISQFLPFSVFNLQKIISGGYAVQSQSTIDLIVASFVLLLWSVGALAFLIIAEKRWLSKGGAQ
jgi:hypothetical protein